MKHLSEIDGATYDISYSCDYKDGRHADDDITLIWKSPACSLDDAEEHDVPPTVLVGWYYGDYDYTITEQCIREHYLDKSVVKPKASATELFNQLNKAYPSDAHRIITKLFMAQEIAGLFQYQELNDKVLDALYEYYIDSDYNIFDLFDVIDSYCLENNINFEDYLRAKGYLD